jgi:hypothetical protein
MDHPNHNHTTPLMRAAQEGHLHCVQFLLDTGQVNVNKRNRQGMTALMLASQRGHAAVVKLLIEKANAQLDVPTIPNRSTALHLACKRGHAAVVRVLVENGCEIFAMDAKRRTVRDIVRKHVTPNHPPEVAQSIVELCMDPLQQIHAMRRAAARNRNWELCKLWFMQNSPSKRHAERAQFRSDCLGEPDARLIYHVTHHFPLPLLMQVAQYLPLPPLYSPIIAMLMNRCAVAPNSTIVTALDVLDELLEVAGILRACDECRIPTPKLPRTRTSTLTWTEFHRFCLFQNRNAEKEGQIKVLQKDSQLGQEPTTRFEHHHQEEEDQEEIADDGINERYVDDFIDNAHDARHDIPRLHRGQQERTNITNVTIDPLPESPTMLATPAYWQLTHCWFPIYEIVRIHGYHPKFFPTL